MIYYIIDLDGMLVKIGFTTDLRSRMHVIQSSTPNRLVLIATHWGELEDERSIHEQWQHLRVRGEWFRLTPELLAFIEENHDDSTLEDEDWLQRTRSDILFFYQMTVLRPILGMSPVTIREFLKARGVTFA